MSLTPMSRHTMRGLKARTDEENRVKKVSSIAHNIYIRAIDIARGSDITFYKWSIENHYRNITTRIDEEYKFYMANMPDIIDALQRLFPGCSVNHSMMAESPDGRLYDISKMDNAAISFIGQGQIRECIIIDWS